MKRTRCGILCCAIAFGLLGCGPGVDDSKVIRVTRNIGGREGFRVHWDLWKSTFEANHPGWTMELIDMGNEDGTQFYKSRIATDDLPEIVMVWNLTKFFADAGHLLPLPDTYYEKFGVPLPPPYQGKRYTTQQGLQIVGMAVNKTMWRDAGITEPPETWERFIENLQTIEARGHRPLIYGAREWSAAEPLWFTLWANLYDYLPDPKKPSWNKRRERNEIRYTTDPTVRLILENTIELVDRFAVKGALSDGYEEEKRDFFGGKGATWIMGCWIAGHVEALQVDLDLEYWPLPSMTGRPPIFVSLSGIPAGWAMTRSAAGAKQEKALAVMEAFYDPGVYQAFLNAEGMFSIAGKLDVTGPQSDWPAARALYANMAENMEEYGISIGSRIALDDMPNPTAEMQMPRVMQEVMVGNRDVDALLQMLDDDWDRAIKEN